MSIAPPNPLLTGTRTRMWAARPIAPLECHQLPPTPFGSPAKGEALPPLLFGQSPESCRSVTGQVRSFGKGRRAAPTKLIKSPMRLQ